jgi:hypothetical protein
MAQIFRTSYTVFKVAAQLYKVYYYTHIDGYEYVVGCGNNDYIYTTVINDTAEVDDFISNLMPSALMLYTEDDVLAYPTLINNSIIKKNFDIGDGYIYIGSAPINGLDSERVWTVKRFILVDGLVTNKQTTIEGQAEWDMRDIETYY